MAQIPSVMQGTMPPGMHSQMPPGMHSQMPPGMPAGYTWNGSSFPMMGDPMSNMMFNNQAAIMGVNSSSSSSANNSESRNRRRSRSKSRERSRDYSGDRRGTKRKSGASAVANKTTEAANTVPGMNQMIMNGMMPGNMMPMGGGMFPPNMMMGGMIPNMMPNSGMEIMPAAAGNMEIMGQAQMDMMNQSGGDMNMMGGMVPMMDPSMMGMGMGMPMGGDVKELVLKNLKLTPPAIGTPLPPRRLKPPGCRTIFIGGLPDKITEDHVREIFERFGRIYTLRLSKKNFCHIRYERENSVDMAIALSGYKLKITSEGEAEETDDKNNSGWLHVDYALSRDDQNDYERRQKRLEREAAREMSSEVSSHSERDDHPHSHPGRMRVRSPSPVARIQPYSNIIVAQISEKIRSEEHFGSAVPTLVAWLERGECQKKNASTFYAMIQSANSQIRRLFNEKMQCDEDLQLAKENAKNQYQKIIMQLEEITKVLTAASHQRVWDHFSKPQRKNIETWHKMTEEFQSIKDEYMEKFTEEENEYGDDKGESSGEVKKLKKEKENLQVQLEAYKNEIELLKADSMRDFEKFKAQFIATQALNSMNDSKPQKPPPPPPLQNPPPPPPLPLQGDDSGEVKLTSEVDPACGEARLIGVMSAFLQVHPRGASLDYVVSYVRAQIPSVNQATVHHVLQRHADVFQCDTTGVGAGIEHRWSFVAFNNN